MLEIREKILHFDEVWYGAAWCVDDWAIKLRLGCTHTHGGQGYLNAGMIHVTEIKTKAQIRAIVIPRYMCPSASLETQVWTEEEKCFTKLNQSQTNQVNVP